MDCFTREESRALRSVFIASILFCLAYSLSTIHGLDAERFMENYNKWGPSARTCPGLAWGAISETELEYNVVVAAKKFAENPRAICMEADREDDPHWLFTSVAMPYLKGFVVEAIARTDAARQVLFCIEASNHPFFRGAFGYVFEKNLYLWLSSNPDNEIPCTAWPRLEEPTRTQGLQLQSPQPAIRWNCAVSDQSGWTR